MLFRSTNANLSNIVFTNPDFRGVKLGSVNLSGSDLSGATFDSTTEFADINGNGVNLSGTNAVLRDLSGMINFRGVNLSSVRFENSFLDQAEFDNTTKFSATNPQTGLVEGVDLSGTGAKISTIQQFDTISFEGAKLGTVDFTGSNLENSTFNEDTQFTDQFGNGANLSGTNANLSNIVFSNPDFSGVKLGSVNLSGSDLSGATFSSTTEFADINGNGVNLSGTNAVLRDL